MSDFSQRRTFEADLHALHKRLVIGQLLLVLLLLLLLVLLVLLLLVLLVRRQVVERRQRRRRRRRRRVARVQVRDRRQTAQRQFPCWFVGFSLTMEHDHIHFAKLLQKYVHYTLPDAIRVNSIITVPSNR